MAVGDVPQMAASTYGATSVFGGLPAPAFRQPEFMGQPDWNAQLEAHRRNAAVLPLKREADARLQIERFSTNPEEKEEVKMANSVRRMVQVFIADPNENVPVSDCLLYQGEPKLTDLTDQELFFEIEIGNLLKAHNEKRLKIVDKSIKDRTAFLGEARIRDLKMLVVTIATF